MAKEWFREDIRDLVKATSVEFVAGAMEVSTSRVEAWKRGGGTFTVQQDHRVEDLAEETAFLKDMNRQLGYRRVPKKERGKVTGRVIELGRKSSRRKKDDYELSDIFYDYGIPDEVRPRLYKKKKR